MKAIKIFDRDRNSLEILKTFSYSSIEERGVNEIEIAGNPKDYIEKIVEVWDGGKLIYGGIIKDYEYDEKENKGVIYIFPLLFDLYEDFYQDSNGNKIVYFSGTIEDLFTDIVNQYIDRVDGNILSLGNVAITGKNISITFNYNSLYGAIEFLQDKILEQGYYVKVEGNGKIHLLEINDVVNLKNGTDIKQINFTERNSENIKTIIFDNGKIGDEQILKTYTNDNIERGRVKYIKDSRFINEESADLYIQNIFSDNSKKIEVEDIISEVDVPLYSKVNIYNWAKNFGDLYVIGKEYIPNESGKVYVNLRLGNELKYEYESDDLERIETNIVQVEDRVEEVAEESKNPEYIQETYIDGVEIKAPTISGNDGYFSGKFKVGTDGIIIDGTLQTTSNPNGQSIYSANYGTDDNGNKIGWKIDKTGNAEFNNGTFRGEINATSGTFSGNITSNATITGGNFLGGTFSTNVTGSDSREVRLDNGYLETYTTIDGTNTKTGHIRGSYSSYTDDNGNQVYLPYVSIDGDVKFLEMIMGDLELDGSDIEIKLGRKDGEPGRFFIRAKDYNGSSVTDFKVYQYEDLWRIKGDIDFSDDIKGDNLHFGQGFIGSIDTNGIDNTGNMSTGTIEVDGMVKVYDTYKAEYRFYVGSNEDRSILYVNSNGDLKFEDKNGDTHTIVSI